MRILCCLFFVVFITLAVACSGTPAGGGGGGGSAGGGSAGGTGGGSAGGTGGGSAGGTGGGSAGGTGGGSAGGTGGGSAGGTGGGSAGGTGGGSAGGSGGGGGGAGGGSASSSDGGTLFDQPHPWTTALTGLAPHTQSTAIINALNAAGGWGSGNFRTDRSLEVLTATAANSTLRAFTPTSDFYTPDCDNVMFPVPAAGAIEGEPAFACTGGGDCHLIVHLPATKKLYEMWRTDITGSSQAQFQGGCVAVWDLAKAYPSTLRGKGCTSADGAGFPIAAMLISPDEVFADQINHAARFTLPNARIRNGIYVAPATHSTGPTSGGALLPPYGSRFRLKASFNVASLTSVGAQRIARALQKYGMFLADGGNIPLTLQSDRFTTHQWSELGINDDLALAGIKVTDFEVMDSGPTIDWKADTNCYRNP